MVSANGQKPTILAFQALFSFNYTSSGNVRGIWLLDAATKLFPYTDGSVVIPIYRGCGEIIVLIYQLLASVVNQYPEFLSIAAISNNIYRKNSIPLLRQELEQMNEEAIEVYASRFDLDESVAQSMFKQEVCLALDDTSFSV